MITVNKRNQNIELLRVVSMFLIITHHCTINGYGLQERLLNSIGGGGYSAFLCMINSFAVIGVNVFFLISGYFGIKPTIKKFAKLVLELYFWADLLTLLSIALGMEKFGFGTLKILVLPFYKYWFVVVYLMLFAVSPVLNFGIERLSKKYSIILLGLLTLAFCFLGFVSEASWFGLNKGYSLMFAIYLYFVGRLMSKWDLDKLRLSGYVVLWLVSTLITAGICFILLRLNKTELAWHMFSYNQPVIALSSVLFLCIFLRMKQREYGNWVRMLAGMTLPVYYIHTCTVFSFYRNLPLKYIAEHGWNLTLQVFFLVTYTCLIYLICAIITTGKHKLLDGVDAKILKKIPDIIVMED